MEVQQVRPLIAVAEGIEAERKALRRLRDGKTEQYVKLLENLIKSSGANKRAGVPGVLRWIVENGGLDGGAELDADVIAGDAWVAVSKPTVYRAIRFLSDLYGPQGPVLRVKDRCDQRGRKLPSMATIDVEAVSAYLLAGVGGSLPQTQVVSNRHDLSPTDTTRLPQTQVESVGDNVAIGGGDGKQAISEAEFESRKRLIAEQLQAAERVAQDSLSHDHDTIDIEERSASCHSTIHDHGHGGASTSAPTVVAQGPVAVGSPLETLVARFADPREQKRRLVSRITGVVSDPLMNAAIPRIAADLVIFEGVPIADLEHILVDVEAMRGAGSLRIPGAFFLQKAREMAGRHGKTWPDPKPEPAGARAGDFE
jgi:hypothetical protein